MIIYLYIINYLNYTRTYLDILQNSQIFHVSCNIMYIINYIHDTFIIYIVLLHLSSYLINSSFLLYEIV